MTRIPHPGKRRGGDDLGVHAAQQHGAVRADESEKQSRPVTRRNSNPNWMFSEATGVPEVLRFPVRVANRARLLLRAPEVVIAAG